VTSGGFSEREDGDNEESSGSGMLGAEMPSVFTNIVNGLVGELPGSSGMRSETREELAKPKFEDFGVSRPCADEASIFRNSSCDRADRGTKSGGGDTQGASGTTYDSEHS